MSQGEGVPFKQKSPQYFQMQEQSHQASQDLCRATDDHLESFKLYFCVSIL